MNKKNLDFVMHTWSED